MRTLYYPWQGAGSVWTHQLDGYCTVVYMDRFAPAGTPWPSYSTLTIYGPEHFQ